MSYLLLYRFRSLFDGVRYRHRVSIHGDSVAWCLPEDLYALHRSVKFNARVDARQSVLNQQNRLRGIIARRGDGTFGELVPHAVATGSPGFVVSRGPVATVEIGTEVKVLANSMIKQIDRVLNDLQNQARQFKTAGGNPITVGIVGINHADSYVSYEGDVEWHTGQKGKKHPIQEAAEATRRLLAAASPAFDEFLILPFRAWNAPPYKIEWVDEAQITLDYGAVLTRVIRKYEARF